MSIYSKLLEKYKSQQALGQPSFRPILVGHDDDGRAIELTFDDFYRHVHILGLSDRGKSRSIEYMLRQFLLNGVGFTLLDPTADLYDALVDWITWQSERRTGFLDGRTVHLFDPVGDPEFCPGYNPLHLRAGEIAEGRVDWVVDAFAAMLPKDDPEAMPLYQFVFNAIIYPLTCRGLTLYEAVRVLPKTEQALVRRLAKDLPNRLNLQSLEEVLSWKPNEYWDRVGTFYRRMMLLMRLPALQRMFGQTENVLDTLEVMDKGQVVLANLRPRAGLGFPRKASQIVGRLLINDYVQTALNFRIANKSKPHIFFVDECQNYLSEDIPRSLDETRKFGLHLVLCHQRIEQLIKASPDIADGVMAGAQTKLFFGSSYKTGLQIADEIFGASYNLERPKESSKRPVLVGHEIERLKGGGSALATSRDKTATASKGGGIGLALSQLEGEGAADGHADIAMVGGGQALGHADLQHAGDAAGTAYGFDNPNLALLPSSLVLTNVGSQGSGSVDSNIVHSTWAHGSVDSHVDSHFRARGLAESFMASWLRGIAEREGQTRTVSETWHETLVPVLEYFYTEYYKLDELRHLAAVGMQTLVLLRQVPEFTSRINGLARRGVWH